MRARFELESIAVTAVVAGGHRKRSTQPRAEKEDSASSQRQRPQGKAEVFLLACQLTMIGYYDKILHKREIRYLGFGGVMQLSTQINHIKGCLELGNR